MKSSNSNSSSKYFEAKPSDDLYTKHILNVSFPIFCLVTKNKE